ncbi:MAG: lysophospholipid acyltransferase family protein [Planctomycetota bacterium]
MIWLWLFTGLATALFAATGIVRQRVRAAQAGWPAWVCYQISVLHRLLFSHCQQNNPCTIPENGPAIIVANHTSPVDPVLLWTRHFSSFRQPRLRVIGYLMAREYYQSPRIINWICRAMQCIPVDRNGRDIQPLRQALRRLQDGHLLGLFPEGRLNATSPNTQLLPADTGVAWLALKARVPIIPVFIHNAPRSSSMALCFLIPTRASLTYGQPLDLSPWHGRRNTTQDLAEATDFIMQSLAALGQIHFTALSKHSPHSPLPAEMGRG